MRKYSRKRPAAKDFCHKVSRRVGNDLSELVSPAVCKLLETFTAGDPDAELTIESAPGGLVVKADGVEVLSVSFKVTPKKS